MESTRSDILTQLPCNRTGHPGRTISLFAEGTILTPKSWWSLCRHSSDIPIENAAGMTNALQKQGYRWEGSVFEVSPAQSKKRS